MTTQVCQEYGSHAGAVRNLRSEIERIRSISSEKEADLFAQAIFGQMMNIMQELRLDPSEYPSIKDHWESAKQDRKNLDSQSSTTTSTPIRVKGSPSGIKLEVHISLNPHGPNPDLSTPSPRQMVFPAKFGGFSFANILTYALAHPKNSSVPPEIIPRPIKFAPMNTLYLRSSGSSNQPSRWRPIVLNNTLTVQEHLDTVPQEQIRFVGSRTPFILVSSNESGKNLEKTFDLNSTNECQAMERFLDKAWGGGVASSAASSSASASSLNQQLSPSRLKPSWKFPPRTCVLIGPGSHEALTP
ncbi:hypothetical protein M407DRAFT_241848 [Tulasnella calospora MUT 4182]|uniref:Uncharacterized protein n=1 Tax=Tulasnella calospora MUT 4182 TaxID=1051891 RepID=A0A0C3MC39_9AGAM|nr:hypothetical protein M407DRAFT_241848 [Tulasnella calospora MUT 4182]